MNLQESFSFTSFISTTKIIKPVPTSSQTIEETYNIYLKLNIGNCIIKIVIICISYLMLSS